MLYDMLKSRRSIRKFKAQEVEPEKIELILKSALRAPSSRSIRPCQFIAITEREQLSQLAQSREHGSGFLSGAPLAIVVLAERGLSDVWIEDATIAATYIQLTAQDLGLGSCWIQVRERFHAEQETTEVYLRELLEIPEPVSVECIIAIGYPGEEKKALAEGALLYEKLHYDKF